MVSKHTYITEFSQSTLDLFFANNSTLIDKVEVIPGFSDHEVVYVESSLRPDKIKKPPRKICLYNKADKQHLRQNITNINLCERNTKNMTTDQIWINFKEKVMKAIDETVRTKFINNAIRSPHGSPKR